MHIFHGNCVFYHQRYIPIDDDHFCISNDELGYFWQNHNSQLFFFNLDTSSIANIFKKFDLNPFPASQSVFIYKGGQLIGSTVFKRFQSIFVILDIFLTFVNLFQMLVYDQQVFNSDAFLPLDKPFDIFYFFLFCFHTNQSF